MGILRFSLLITFIAAVAASPFAPRASSGTTYELRVLGHGTLINATGGFFYTGLPTEVDCPDFAGFSCAGYPNATYIGVGSGGADMDAYVPGGQTVYVSPYGELSFTEPHGEFGYPNGSFLKTFSIAQSGTDELFEFQGAKAEGWVTCGSLGQIFALIPGIVQCSQQTPIKIRALHVSGQGAYEYI